MSYSYACVRQIKILADKIACSSSDDRNGYSDSGGYDCIDVYIVGLTGSYMCLTYFKLFNLIIFFFRFW